MNQGFTGEPLRPDEPQDFDEIASAQRPHVREDHLRAFDEPEVRVDRAS